MDWIVRTLKGKDAMLYNAIKEGNLKKIKDAIEKGADPNKKYPSNRPIFYASVEQDNIEIFKYLLDHGAEINEPVFDKHGDIDITIQAVVAYNKPKKWLQILDDHGAKWDSVFKNAIGYAAYGQNRPAMEFLIPKIGIDHEGYIDDTKGNVLHHALRNDDDVTPEFIAYLLDNGADVLINGKDEGKNNTTPLMCAVDHPSIMLLLIERGADLNLRDLRRNTALHLAVERENLESVRILIEAGANLDIQNVKWNTALHLAVEHNNSELVKLLIESGANQEIENDVGSPLYLAQKKLDAGRGDHAELNQIIKLLQGGGPITIEAAEHKGDLEISAGITNAISYDDIEDGDEVVVIFGKTTSSNYLYKREGLEGWFTTKRQYNQPLTNPLTNEIIKKQTDLTRYTAKIVPHSRKQRTATHRNNHKGGRRSKKIQRKRVNGSKGK